MRLFLSLTTVGYVAWHLATTLTAATEIITDSAYAILPVAGLALGISWLALRRDSLFAAWAFTIGGLITVTWAASVLATPDAALLDVELAMVASFVIGPTAGGAVVVAGIALLLLLESLQPGVVGLSDVWRVAGFSGLAVGGVWAVRHHLLLALAWYASSYARAEQQTQEAREHRAELAQAWKELDAAYHRIERANAALRFAWRAADEAERSKMELAVNVSHELRTPLNLIAGYSEMMMTSPGSYGGITMPLVYRGDLHAIYRGAQHLISLTDDVLDLARMEVGHLGLTREPDDLSQVIRDAVALIRDYAETKGLVLGVEMPLDVPVLLFDRVRIRQVLLNLLGNAARMTERGSITVRLAVRKDDVRVEVSDTGPGIAPDDLVLVFQRFASRDRLRSDWQGSTGLGLPISKRFVELHGGEMGVDSELGVGTVFWFTLPQVEPDGIPAVPIPARLTPDHLGPLKHLVILAHQEPAVARQFQRHLESCRVESAIGLIEASELARKMGAAAIVADLDALPDSMTGPVPVVRCPLPESRRLSEGLGTAGYLVKPVSRKALLDALASLAVPIHRVLVTDDDERFARLITRMLRSSEENYQVSLAYNGEEALARMRVERPDLLLLDLAMPGMDGVGVLSRMAMEPDLADVPVIIISAHGEGEGSTPLGRQIVVDKPEGFRLAELTRVVGAIVGAMEPVRAHLTDHGETVPESPRGQPG